MMAAGRRWVTALLQARAQQSGNLVTVTASISTALQPALQACHLAAGTHAHSASSSGAAPQQFSPPCLQLQQHQQHHIQGFSMLPLARSCHHQLPLRTLQCDPHPWHMSTRPLSSASTASSSSQPNQQQPQQQPEAATSPASASTPSTDGRGPDGGSPSASAPEQHQQQHQQHGQAPNLNLVNPHLLDARSNAPLVSAQFPSSTDDKFGVQKNWFTSLYKQLNYMAKTGAVPNLKGRQREVFEQVEHDFESLYNKYIHGKQLDEVSHRALLMCCLSIATYRTLYDEVNDTRLVRDVIRTNLGSVMLSLLMPLHRFKLWLLSWLMREDMYKEAAKMLPALRADMGELCEVEVMRHEAAAGGTSPGPATAGGDETVMKVHKCKYHEILTQEDTPFLLTEFCCHHALIWLHEFRRHGVVVSMDQCKAWDDGCCQLRIARAGTPAAADQTPPPPNA